MITFLKWIEVSEKHLVNVKKTIIFYGVLVFAAHDTTTYHMSDDV